MEHTFSIKGLLAESRAIIKPRLWKVVGQYALVGALSVLASMLAGKNMLVSAAVSVFFGVFTIILSVRYARHGSATLGDVFDSLTWKGCAWFFLVSLVTGVSIVLGVVLLVVPGVYLAVHLSLAKYLAVDKHMAPLAAWRESFRRTKGHGWKILGFVVVMGLVNLLGLLCLVVGLLYTMPLTLIAYALMYEKLMGGAAESVSAEAVEETVVEAVIAEAETPAAA